MNDIFELRVRCAAAAGWWTFLIGLGFLLVQWIIYLVFMALRPNLELYLWGPNASWDTVRNVWFWGLALIKLWLLLLAFIALWLALWARQLRKH
jgi:hypothetical protein